ncbi:PREDICTED: RNA-binding protein 47-like [Nicrophorus vespilloides]|uniref:RNA-binding protein 47-like n=1 Tax=Nicrophorus vespilloides TaxID=110193 RepID=A0ABM1MKA7_NICVS|nr:PREDICTED: RNA-binding protein 47-like [Nicrophorus vespilloides]
MLLLLAFCREQNYGLSTSIIMLEKLSAIHNYDLRTIECFKIFGPPKDFQHDEPSSDCEIVIYNIPIDESEDILVATLLAFSNLYYLKIVISKDGRHRGIAFAKFSNASEARKAIKKLETTMIYTHNNLHAKPCDTCNTNLYIGIYFC